MLLCQAAPSPARLGGLGVEFSGRVAWGVGEGLRGLPRSRARWRLDEGRVAGSSVRGGRARDSADAGNGAPGRQAPAPRRSGRRGHAKSHPWNEGLLVEAA